MATSNEDIRDALIKHQIQLIQQSGAASCEIIKLLEDAHADLRDRIDARLKKIVEQGSDTGETTTKRLLALERNIAAILGRSYRKIDKRLRDIMQDIRAPMRVVANCLREYGMMVTDHGGNRARQRASTQFEHSLSGKWGEIGISNDRVLTKLHALLEPNRSRARVLDIPGHAGGSDANVACYPGVDYPSGHPCNSD